MWPLHLSVIGYWVCWRSLADTHTNTTPPVSKAGNKCLQRLQVRLAPSCQHAFSRRSACFNVQVVPLRSVHPKFLFGSGKAAEMAGGVSAADADTVFVNAPLSGQQQKALSATWGGSKVRAFPVLPRVGQDGVVVTNLDDIPSGLRRMFCSR